MPFHFEKLDAFVVARLPPGRAYVRDQIRRSSNSVVLNTAEGAGEFSPAEKARFYRMAKRSATETAAQLMVMERLQLVEDTSAARALLERVVSMLVRMVNAAERRPAHPSPSPR